MSNWMMMASRGNPNRKMLVRLDAIQYVEEGHGGKTGIGFGGEDGCFMLFEEPFDDVVEAIRRLGGCNGDRIIEVSGEVDTDEQG